MGETQSSCSGLEFNWPVRAEPGSHRLIADGGALSGREAIHRLRLESWLSDSLSDPWDPDPAPPLRGGFLSTDALPTSSDALQGHTGRSLARGSGNKPIAGTGSGRGDRPRRRPYTCASCRLRPTATNRGRPSTCITGSLLSHASRPVESGRSARRLTPTRQRPDGGRRAGLRAPNREVGEATDAPALASDRRPLSRAGIPAGCGGRGCPVCGPAGDERSAETEGRLPRGDPSAGTAAEGGRGVVARDELRGPDVEEEAPRGAGRPGAPPDGAARGRDGPYPDVPRALLPPQQRTGGGGLRAGVAGAVSATRAR